MCFAYSNSPACRPTNLPDIAARSLPALIREQLERLRSGAFLEDAINVVAAANLVWAIARAGGH